MTTRPILWSYFLSSSSWRVRIALNLKKIDYEYRPVDLLKNKGHGDQYAGEFVALNPKQEVPVLQIDGHLLTQSLPIIEYLNETRPGGVDLLPGDPMRRARARMIAEIINSGIQPYHNLNVVNKITEEMGKTKRDEWLKFYVCKGLKSIEQILAETNSDGKYCIGNNISLADLCLVPQVNSAKRFKVKIADYPLIDSISTHLDQIDEFKQARPENQIDYIKK